MMKRALLAAAIAVVLGHNPAGQAGGSFTVTTAADGGPGSLRNAIIQANTAGGASDIILAPGQIYELTIPDPGFADSDDTAANGDLDILATITIRGNGATIRGGVGSGFASRIFEVIGALNLHDVTVTGGFGCGEPISFSGEPPIDGGGILHRGSGLVLSHVNVSGNTACGGGGGIANSGSGTVAIDASTISGNTAFKGGGIFNASCCNSQLRITGSTIAGNSVNAGAGGGGIYNLRVGSPAPNQLVIVASTISRNIGGGLLNNGSAALTNVTVAGNQSLAAPIAGGVGNAFSLLSPLLQLQNSVLAGNVNSALGSPTTPSWIDCSPGFGIVQSLGNNLRSSTECDAHAGWLPSDILAADPGLGGLGHFGGATQTIRLKPTSPAIDAGNDGAFRGNDQRDVAQFGVRSDVGAFEFVPGLNASFSASDTAPLDGAAVMFTNTSTTANPGGISYFWDFGDGSHSMDASPTHAFAAPDHPITYTVTLQAFDDSGSAGEASVTIAAHPANAKPFAAFSQDVFSGAVGQAVSFDASASNDTDGAIVDYDWNWGDGQSGTGVLATHVWARPGTFTVTLTVTDDGARTATANSTVFIVPLNFHVDDDWAGIANGDDPDGAGPATSFGVDAFATIAGAMSAAATGVSGTTIHVAAGTYVEGSLFLSPAAGRLLGAGRDVTHVVLETLNISGFAARVEGFHFTGADAFAPVIRLRSAADQATVSNNRIGGGEHGVLIESSDSLVQGNQIEQAAVHGISVRDAGNAIVDNTIAGSGTSYSAANPREVSGIEIGGNGNAANATTVTGNTITGSHFAGIKVGDAAGASISGNKISETLNGGANGNVHDSAGGAAILITRTGSTNTTITRNQLGPNSGYGILQADSSGASSGGAAHLNAITDNVLGGVVNRDVAVFDARNNWWGHGSGPHHATLNPSGTGNAVSDNVLFDPFGATAACFGFNACPLSLAVTQQPGNAFAGAPLGTQPIVQVQDAAGNLQAGSTAAVTATIMPGTGKAGAILSGTTTVNAVGGVATFTDLKIDRAGNDFKLRFSSSAASGAASNTFGVTGSVVTGHVFANAVGNPLVGAAVSVCKGSICAAPATTTAGGVYTVSGVSPGTDVIVKAHPPSGTSFAPASVGPITVPGFGGSATADIILTLPVGPPIGTAITPSTSDGGVPSVLSNDPLTLTTSGCANGMASYTITSKGTVVRSGAMIEGPAGKYSAGVAPLTSVPGMAHVEIAIVCPAGAPVVIGFDIYIDPSGFVQRPDGSPIFGAIVSLFRLDEETGNFVQVPDGSAIMSPSNRRNPDRSNANGHFGWDTIAGLYKVRAEKIDCVAPGTGAPFVETEPLEVPPPRLDLLLVLECPNSVTTTSLVSNANPSIEGQAVTLTATVAAEGSPLPLGTLAFRDGSTGALLFVAVPDHNGQARMTTPPLPRGTHVFTVEYLPAPGYEASEARLEQTVQAQPTASFGIRLLYDPQHVKKAGSAYPVKLQLLDTAGLNVSAPDIVVKAVRIVRTAGEADGPLDDSGHANPDFDFRYDGGLGGYVFNLKTTGLSAGRYTLIFRAGADPVEHAAPFSVR